MLVLKRQHVCVCVLDIQILWFMQIKFWDYVTPHNRVSDGHTELWDSEEEVGSYSPGWRWGRGPTFPGSGNTFGPGLRSRMTAATRLVWAGGWRAAGGTFLQRSNDTMKWVKEKRESRAHTAAVVEIFRCFYLIYSFMNHIYATAAVPCLCLHK